MSEFMARGLQDEHARFLIRTQLRPTAPALRLIRRNPVCRHLVSLHDCHGAPSNLSCHRAMLLDDDCHPIDYLNMFSILENVKFPNYSFRLTEPDFRLFAKG
jgi:hypothetical protein